MSTRKLTIRKAISLYDALSALDGHAEVTYDEAGKPQRGKVTPYKFGAGGAGGGKVRYAIVKNLSILKRVVDDYSKARDAVLVDISGGSGLLQEADSDKIAKLNVEIGKLMDHEEEVAGLISIALNDLNLDENLLLPNTVIAQLDPLLTD